MKISYNWLKDYLDINLPVAQMAEILTDTGLEVSGIESFQSVRGGLKGLVIGEVKTKEKHPNADRLSVTTVDVGTEILPIVCGAPNVETGQKVVVATPGTVLYPSEGESFEIRKSKIRGERSEGMICAEDEIGIGEGHDGIMVLDSSIATGTLASEYFEIENDTVIEIDLTPNRVDGASHIGVARDLEAALNLKKKSNYTKPSISNFKEGMQEGVQISVEDKDACPRYAGVTITDVEVKESPKWLKNKLIAIGLKPINNVVDITNFVLHELGQPLHAFDANKISGKKIVVKKLKENTPFTTLDSIERKLSANDLMICDGDGNGLCIAGVFGGLNSGVSTETTDVFLESAYFNPVSVRKTAKKHGLNTDASFRFERGVDPENTVYALKRAALLIQELAGGKILSKVTDLYPQPIDGFQVSFSLEKCAKVIGKQIDKQVVLRVLQGLEIDVVEDNNDQLLLKVPAYRVDVQREIDVIEEVLRIYGYNNIELPEAVKSSLAYRLIQDENAIKNSISDLLTGNGYLEMMNNSLTSATYPNEKRELSVKILNPLSSELDVLRQTLLFGALEVTTHNINRQTSDLKFYEFGTVYQQNDTERQENQHLALLLTGKFYQQRWNIADETINFFHLKGMIELIIQRLGIDDAKLRFNEITNTIFSTGAELYSGDKLIVSYGQVANNLIEKFDIKQAVYFAEFNWTNVLILLKKKQTVQFKAIPKFPAVRRDLALLIDKSVSFKSIYDIAIKQEKQLLKKVDLFDVYQGKNLEEGKKSYAVSFIFQDERKTLTDKQIDKTMNKIISSLKNQLGAELR